MGDWNLRAVMYDQEGNYLHWALCATQDGKRTAHIFEVTGEHGYFEPKTTIGRPENTKRFVESIDLCTILDRDFDDLLEVVEDTVVDNETVEWDCQDYVLEILDNLEEQFIIEPDDEVYLEQKRKLRNKRGPT